MAACAGADKLFGVLSLGFDLDFTSQVVKNVKSGKSTTFTESETESLIDCEKREFSNVSLVGIAHKHDAYTVFYKIEFPKFATAAEGKGEPAAAAGDVTPADVTEASGHATVAWDVALVRSSASRDGTVVARVLQGTRISVTGRSRRLVSDQIRRQRQRRMGVSHRDRHVGMLQIPRQLSRRVASARSLG